MVGSLGIRATAAVGVTSTVNWLIGSTVSAIGVGFLTLISQAIGAGNRGRAKKFALFFLFGNRYRSGKWNILREDQPRESREMSGTKEKSSRKTGKTGGRYSREEAEDVSFDHYR